MWERRVRPSGSAQQSRARAGLAPGRESPKTERMSSNTCEIVCGRLMEIRVASGYRSVADVNEMVALVAAAAKSLPNEDKFVIAADWRAVHIMAPDTAARAKEMLAGMNPRVRRSGILTLPENSMTNLQVVRLVREAENDNRRHFTAPREMHAWLAELLTPEESERLNAFLDLTSAGSPR